MKWTLLLKAGFFLGIGWWLSVAATTLLDYGVQFIAYSLVGAVTGQGV